DATDRMILDIDATDYIQINASGKIEPISFTSPIIYVDGTIASSTDTNWHYTVITDTTGVNASAMNISKVSTSYFYGIIDEVRISSTVRHAGWIETEYNNQSGASSFLTINAEESLKLVITTSAKTLTAGTESTAFTVQAQDLSNNPINMGSDTIINLSSDSSLYSFASTTGGTEISSITIPYGSDSADFYYTDHKAGSPTITVSATNLTPDTQQQTVQARDPWYNASYSYRRKITLEADQIATTTDAFPILVNDTLADMKTTTHSGKVSNDNGYDIVFVNDDNSTLLNFEKEKYASTTGEIVYWIKTDISSTTDKTIYMYYGNASAEDQATTTGVWDDNFVMVQHLQETDIDDGAGDIKDSTKYVNNGTTVNMNTADQVTGLIGGSLDFDGSNDYINCGNNTSVRITSAITISAWIKSSSLNNWSVIASKGHSETYTLSASHNGNDYGSFRIWDSNTEYLDNNTGLDLADNQWHFVVGTYDGSLLQIYGDGNAHTAPTSHVGDIDSTADNLLIGHDGASAHELAKGLIDEVRISNIARTAGWIETEYNNQSDIGSFMTIFGVEEGILTISTDPKVITAGTESTAFTVQVDHNVSADVTVNLSSDSSGTYHFAATPGGAEVSSVTIPSGTSSVDLYYTDYQEGSPVIVVAATNFVSDDQQQTVVKIITQLNSPHANKWTDGLVGYWSLDGQDMDWASTTAEALDRSGQANHGDVNGAKAAIGKVGQGLGFDGDDDYVDIGNVYNGIKTVNFWIKAGGLTKKIIDLNGTADIEVVSGTITANNLSNTIYVDGAVSSAIDTDWHHIAIATGTAINANAVDIGRIGAGYFNGILDEVRVYNRALSADEIAEQYRVGARKFQIDPSKGYKTIIE
ncbi:DUF2341 domain-containing protein, partial [Candidatus Parcubacteria bacterium]|nr:DUF2341 domain-containing protein [Candidatus Parcubacteria bacterium]